MLKHQLAVFLSVFLFPWICFCGQNLIKDASFEDKLPLWFDVHGRRMYYAGKTIAEDAPDGKTVMTIKGWPVTGSLILSPVIEQSSMVPELSESEDDSLADLEKELTSNKYSIDAKLRSFGPGPGPEVEFLLYDEKGRKQLASFGKMVLNGDGKWELFEKRGIQLKTDTTSFRLGIRLKGPKDPNRDRHLELDQVGLFSSEKPGKVRDNSDTHIFEAETLADGIAWKKVDHYGGWYYGTPSNMKMLAGFHSLKPGQKNAVSKTVEIKEDGDYKLWVRYLTSKYPGEFTITVKQNGKPVASHTSTGIATGSYRWEWSSFALKLKKGKAEITLSRPKNGSSWITRKLDLFILTNNLNYQPNVHDFMPAGYMRFTNLSENQEPFCLWIWVRRHQKPWFANPGILSLAGNSRSYYVPTDKSLWLAKGKTSPWIKISDDLLHAGGRNNVSMTATRNTHTSGFVKGRIKGKLEFALGREKKILKSIDVDQDAPKIILSLPADFEKEPEKIRSAWDFIRQKQEVLKGIKTAGKKRAQHLNLLTILSFNTALNDSKIIAAELEILKKLGFNGTYRCIVPPDKALDFYEKVGMKPAFGTSCYTAWSKGASPDPFHPDEKTLDGIFKGLAEKNKPILDHLVRLKVMDEPGGMTYEAIVDSEPCQQRFREDLKKKGFTPEKLGVFSWDEVKPVLPKQSDQYPQLFYHTGMFRLRGNAILCQAITKQKRKYIKEGALTYVNYVPNWSGSNLVQRGTDPFMMQRNNGLEMLWTEDWFAYGAGPQHVSQLYALLWSAGQGRQPLGVYVVAGNGRNPALLRTKIYSALAGGARTLVFYSYGPAYAGIDSWSMKHSFYPEISRSLHELTNIDQAFDGTKRRKTDIAILYNRTASIWEKKNYVSEQNAQYTHWALAHAGYDADYIPEEDIVAGRLDEYKVLYIDGIQLRKDVAEKIADWVKKGGILFGSAAAGIRDQYNKPMKVLNEVFALNSSAFPKPENDAPIDSIKLQSAGRPKYELRKLTSYDTLKAVPGTGVPAAQFDQLCIQETLEPATRGKVILENPKGKCAGIRNSYGSGTAIRIAGLPGVSYLYEAVKGKDYHIHSYLPRKFSQSLKELIVWPAELAKAGRIAETTEPITEIVRYDAEDRAVVFIIDHDGAKKGKMTIQLFDAGQFTKAYSASGNPVKIQKQGDNSLLITMPLDVADAIVLEE